LLNGFFALAVASVPCGLFRINSLFRICLPNRMKVISILGFQYVSGAALTLEKESVLRVANQIAARLLSYYEPNEYGVYPPNSASDATGAQWYEGGVYWGAYFEYVRLTRDLSNVDMATQALVNASFGDAANFLGPPAMREIQGLQGKWNDDILWWAMPAASGAQTFGGDAIMKGGKTYLQLAQNTLDMAYEQWDPKCGGGIYWSRDRNSAKENQRTYKSTITNVQYMYVCAKMYSVTKQKIHLEQFDQIYSWLKSSGIVSSTFQVADGVIADCTTTDVFWSYNAGMLLAALGEYRLATGQSKYDEDSKLLLRKTLDLFAPNGILTDGCEADYSCKENLSQFKGPLARGLQAMFLGTVDQKLKSDIKQVVDASLNAMMKTCDNLYNCDSIWEKPRTTPARNYHTQQNAQDLINAAVAIYASPDLGVIQRNQVRKQEPLALLIGIGLALFGM
jgi:mannan endo-1,6-alpha-mannosidase